MTPDTLSPGPPCKLGCRSGPGGGVVRCPTPSRRSQEHGTTKDRSLVGASYTAKDGTKKSSLWAGAAGHSAGTDAQADGQ
jgi:hypothetical protein